MWNAQYSELIMGEFGWPLRASRLALWWDYQGNMGGEDTLIIQLDGTRRLPTRVLPLGFALNTLFYAAVLLGVVEFVAFARRRVRRGGGRCPACGYDPAGRAEGSACPECGGKARM
jgi:hypothetical protein